MTPFMNRFVQAKQAVDAVRPLMELLYPSAGAGQPGVVVVTYTPTAGSSGAPPIMPFGLMGSAAPLPVNDNFW